MSTLIQRSLSGGELTPELWTRTDTTKYAAALRKLRNAFVMKHGGAMSRGGTSFVAEVQTSSKTVRLMPFIFNKSQTYVLEFGDLYLRIHTNGAPVLVSGVAAYAGGTAYNIADLVVSGGINYYCIQAGTGHTPASSPLFWYPLTGSIYEIPTPYVMADVMAMDFVESADVITIAHPNYPPAELSRLGNTKWTLANISFAALVNPPTGVTNNGGAGVVTQWVVTTVDPNTGEESIASTPTLSGDIPTSAAPKTVSWSQVSGKSYNVYRSVNGTFSLLGPAGISVFPSYVDMGIAPDTAVSPPTARNPFSGAGDYPAAVGYIQQRLTFGRSNNNPTTAEMSRSGIYHNFTKSIPTQDDDAISFRMVGQQVNPIKFFVDLGSPLIFTEAGEWSLDGDQSGIIKPSAVNPKQHAYEGSSSIKPLVVSGDAIYVQAAGSVVRNLAFNFQRGKYDGDDLSIYSDHLFQNHSIVDWAFQKIPQSVVWAVRDDGTLLSLTYNREHQITGWGRHDFDGTVENVCCVPEGNYTATYLVIKRTINGSTKRYVERMTDRRIANILDFIGMDCANSYDGRNTTADTATLSGGTSWDETEQLTLTLSANNFLTLVASDATNQNQIFLTGADGKMIRFTIKHYTSATVVTGFADRAVPASLQSTATSTWSHAVSHLSGLSFLEGKMVSVFADGYVVGSPNNAAYAQYTVSAGAIVLDRPYAVIHVGLPITVDIETLDIDMPSSETMSDKYKLVGAVTLHLVDSRGIWIGGVDPSEDIDNTASDPLWNLTELKVRQNESYDSPVALLTGKISQSILPEWNSNGHVFIRQVDPVPLSIAGIAADGLYPMKGGG